MKRKPSPKSCGKIISLYVAPTKHEAIKSRAKYLNRSVSNYLMSLAALDIEQANGALECGCQRHD